MKQIHTKLYCVEHRETFKYLDGYTIGVKMAKVRGVRFTEQEETLIEEFLKKNPFFDFSTLSKVAILEFIKRPSINFTPVTQKQKREVKNVRTI
jgi:hypothetical protein